MAAPYSPSVRRRRLSAELKRLRTESGMTLVEAAKRAGMGKSNLSKIEQAESKTVPAPTLNKLLDLYEVRDSTVRRAMHELSKLAGQKGWWSSYKDVMPQILADFEAEACAIRTFEPQLVPGLLQTPAYADAVFRANRVRDDAEISQRVAARMARQTILNRVDPPTYLAIIDEAALHRTVGSPAVMREQLRHLTHLAARHNIDIYVLPFSAGAHTSTEGSYLIMDFPDPRDSSIVYLEGPATTMYLEEDHQIRAFNAMFGSTQSCSMTPVQTLETLKHLIQDLEE
ncbi:helix-turn-helix transcriptional regulator [Nocardiopsis sp. FR4]|uniref:helix-turn-helix domain-containing protein n=1 Tax=Nocardiopsis sp. FR4 TaxID=2605985 RepID=UPI0013592573|nr:helix-turn-helix transcriptional regulator [Nocardiopsis sp. FR4]